MVASSMGNVVVQATPVDCAYFKALVVGVVARSGDALPMPWGTLAGLHVFCSSPALHLSTAVPMMLRVRMLLTQRPLTHAR